MSVEFSKDTALVVVDVQHDFAHPDGSLFVSGATESVPVVVDLVNKALEAGSPVVYTADAHPEETPHFDIWPVHCVKGTKGAELMPQLPKVDSPLIKKGMNGEDGYSGFTMRDLETNEDIPTELEEYLRSTGAKELVIVGIATDVCVLATVMDALDNGWKVTVAKDACAGVVEENSVEALEKMANEGAVVV